MHTQSQDQMLVKQTSPRDTRDRKLPPVKPGRVDGRNSSHRSGGFVPKKLNNEIELVLQAHKDKAIHKDKKVGQITQDRRRTVIKGFFADLIKLKNPRYPIASIYNLKQKHLRAVFHKLETEGQAPSTIQNKISIMRSFCGWIGKHGMVGDSANYVLLRESVRRSMVVQEDKSWEGNGVDLVDHLSAIAAKDPAVAAWLELSWAFGLRVKEAILLRPVIAYEDPSKPFIWVREGTKGGRPRVIPVVNEVQTDVLVRAQQIADKQTGLLGKRGRTYEQKRRHFYAVLESLGFTLGEAGVSAHGLRHEYVHRRFKELTGQEAPVKGGDLRQIDSQAFHEASQKMAEEVGHTRPSICSAYYGSRRVPGV